MVGFHLAAGRVSGHDDGAAGNQHNNTNDEIESDFSDFDQPYHETASNWFNRHDRRRSRRLAGISSSSSSSSSEDCNSLESEDDLEGNDGDNGGQEKSKRKEMEKAARSANRPLTKWLISYPLVAARFCLSSIPSTMNTMTTDTSNGYGKTQLNNSHSTLPPREQETKKLRRIFRRLIRKQKEFQLKFIENNSSSGQKNSSYYQTSNALSLEQTMRINQDGVETGSDQLAIHSFLPQGTGISFIDAVLARGSLLQSKLALENAMKQQQTLSRLVLELVSNLLMSILVRFLF
mmetsp:Transcript_19671/g.34585  ORF Transcript_19671/g.34585 Transcript_19671/m.34585 type:complete len:291 (+) Transcript_19671:65-937(+)